MVDKYARNALKCSVCKDTFYVRNYRIKTAKFCSTKCQLSVAQRFLMSNNSFQLKGKNHWNWKGGIKKDKKGYVLVRSVNHPFRNNQNYVREHRLVVEKTLGRYLYAHEEIHHINGVKHDNRPENLKVLSKSEHARLHALLRNGK